MLDRRVSVSPRVTTTLAIAARAGCGSPDEPITTTTAGPQAMVPLVGGDPEAVVTLGQEIEILRHWDCEYPPCVSG